MTRVMVIYASRHGATHGIADRLAAVLRGQALDVSVFDASQAPRPDGFDALVIGGAAYMGKWLEPVPAYLTRNREAICRRYTWLYSSGPVGTEKVDKKGVDLLAPPAFLRHWAQDLGARGARVFFGRWDPDDPPMTVAERLFKRLPVSRDILPVGDFRDWPAIEQWGREIADELLVASEDKREPAPVAAGARAD